MVLQYEVGHLDRVAAIETQLTRHPGLALVGGVYLGGGLTDIVRSAEQPAEHQIVSRAAIGP